MTSRRLVVVLAVSLVATLGAGSGLAQCVVGVTGGGGGLELPQLQGTLSSLGFTQVIIATTADAQTANANVIIDRYDANNLSSGSVTTWLNTGKGYIQLGDWPGYFANNFVGFPPGPITVNVTDPSSPLAAGLPSSWTGMGFWTYGFSTNYIDSATDLSLPDVLHAMQGSNTYDHVATTQLVGTGRAAFLGINTYGSLAGTNDFRLLYNAVTWAGACAGSLGIPTTGSLGLAVLGGLLALAAVFVIVRVR